MLKKFTYCVLFTHVVFNKTTSNTSKQKLLVRLRTSGPPYCFANSSQISREHGLQYPGLKTPVFRVFDMIGLQHVQRVVAFYMGRGDFSRMLFSIGIFFTT